MTEPPSRRWSRWAAIAALIAAAPAAARDAITAETLTDEHARAAIAALVEELYARADPTRFWEPARLTTGESPQTGGYTALAVLALLHAGETYQHPRLRDGVRYLERVPMQGTYARAVRASVWAMLPPKFHTLLVEDTQWLIDGFANKVGGWTYRQNPATTRRDNSITQYGALAWWEAAKRGVSIDRRYWLRLEERFLDTQLAEGGWNYKGDGPATGSMTSAGLATLFITQDYLHADKYRTPKPSPPARSERAIERGLRWMGENFSPSENPGRDEYFFYYLYGVERVGLASGYKYFGDHDWFRQAAAEIIGRLCRWDPKARRMTVHERMKGAPRGAQIRVRHLAFAILFLSRGRVPVAINKLQTPNVAWNNRPRDVANLTRWLGERTESPLNWQIVGLDAAPHEWLDAPLLYLASHERLPWGATQVQADKPLGRLKRYLDLGGLLLAAAEGASSAFGQSVEEAGRLMYPDFRWRALPDDHWAYTLLWPLPGRRPPLRGLSNGVRELIILSPSTDLAASWQVRATSEVANYLTAAHIYLYASEMNRPRPRLARHWSAPGSAPTARPAVTIVRASHRGNWKPEPLALDVFSATRTREITILDVPLSGIDALEPRPTLVIVNGIDAHNFDAAEKMAIADYVKGGGVILFETPGGRGVFTVSAERACTEIFARPIRSLLRSRVITGEGLPGAKRLSRVDYRPYTLEVFAARETRPRLRGMTIEGEARVLFSRQDISQALLDQPCWGVSGYAPASARDLLGNILEHASDLSGGD